MNENKKPDPIDIVDRVKARDIREKTHTYYIPYKITKKDEPTKHHFKLESYRHILTYIKNKDKKNERKKVAKEFNKKMREKYDPDIYEGFTILWDALILDREEAEKIVKRENEAQRTVSMEIGKKRRP